MTKAYYGPSGSTNNEYRLSPAPQVSITTEPYYSGDVLIGYTHNVSLRGYAASYRKTNNSSDPSYSISGLGLVADSISIVKEILGRNGSELSIQEDDGTDTIKCKGGTLRSLSFNESPNNWMGYSEYSATIEFNEVELINGSSLETIACSDSLLGPKSTSIVDIDQFKIKAFTDSWSIGVEDSIYNRIINTDISGQNIDVENSSMTVTYTISATGKNYYVADKLIPAWEQAKNFAQNRLFNKVTNMLVSTLGRTADTACDASSSLGSLGSSTDSILKNLNGIYGIYNETISCTTSESDGTFSATYNATIKKKNTSEMNHPASRHTFNKTINKQNENNKITTISIQGTIEGMVEGGIITADATGFKLPQNGSILANSSTKTKYSEALTAFNKIINGSDLKLSIKNKLGITNTELGLVAASLAGCSNNPSGPPPASFNLTHNYHEGTINYNIEYSSNNVCGQSKEYAITSISVENPVPVLAEFPLPRTGVLILQDIGTKTAKKISINIEGRTDRSACLTAATLQSKISGASFVLPNNLALPDPSMFVLTQKQRTDNIMEGSYSISLAYTCIQACSN